MTIIILIIIVMFITQLLIKETANLYVTSPTKIDFEAQYTSADLYTGHQLYQSKIIIDKDVTPTRFGLSYDKIVQPSSDSISYLEE